VELAQKRIGGGGLKKLLATRQGTLAVALAAVVVAAGILMLALKNYRQSVNAANAQEIVLVASSPIEKGTSGASLAAQRLYLPTKVLQKQLSPGALTDAAALDGKVAVTNILPGQQLTAGDFAVSTSLASQLASNQRAVEIPLDSNHGLGGVVQGGDHVDVYAGLNSTAGETEIKLLISNVLVLEVNGGTSSGAVSSGGMGNVVLAVNANQAAEVAYASDNGRIWLVLRPGNATNATQTTANLGTVLLSPPANGTGGAG
jgi:pilus assembly protein CpaB